jgi:hypothetical protein
MHELLARLLPMPADNEFRGPKLALVVFALLTAVSLGRSLIHVFADDAGLNRIATLIRFGGDPDPDAAIYLFGSLWGLAQLGMALCYAVVLFRYRSLVPLMYASLVLEWGGRLLIGRVMHPLDDRYFTGTAPGAAGAVPVFVLVTAMLYVCLRPARGPGSNQGRR